MRLNDYDNKCKGWLGRNTRTLCKFLGYVISYAGAMLLDVIRG